MNIIKVIITSICSLFVSQALFSQKIDLKYSHYMNYDGYYFSYSPENRTATIYRVGNYKSQLNVPSQVIDYGYVNSWMVVHELSKNLFSKNGNSWDYIKDATYAELPSSLSIIGQALFKNNTTIEKVKVHAAVNIPSEIFSGCNSLTSVSWNDAKEVGTFAFYHCTNLKSMSFVPKNVSIYKEYSFSETGLLAFDFGEKTKIISQNAFSFVSEPQSLKLPNSVEFIDESAFHFCRGLKIVDVGNGPVDIASNAFASCSNLKYIIGGTKLKSIKRLAFSECPNIKEIYMSNVTPPVCEPIAFSKETKQKATLYVPKGTYAAYWSSPEWEDFKIVEKSFEPIQNIEVKDTLEVIKGSRVRLPYVISPNTASITDLKFTSSNPSVLDISEDGFIQANVKGETTVTIYAQDGSGVKNICHVIVSEPKISQFEVSPKSIKLQVNELDTLEISIKPDDTNKAVTWKSSNNEIVVVKEKKGKAIVLGRAVGKASVIATSVEQPEISDTCKIEVVEEKDLVGDVNEDGVLDEKDQQSIAEMLLNRVKVIKTADVNRDGVVNGLDFVKLSKLINRKEE